MAVEAQRRGDSALIALNELRRIEDARVAAEEEQARAEAQARTKREREVEAQRRHEEEAATAQRLAETAASERRRADEEALRRARADEQARREAAESASGEWRLHVESALQQYRDEAARAKRRARRVAGVGAACLLSAAAVVAAFANQSRAEARALRQELDRLWGAARRDRAIHEDRARLLDDRLERLARGASRPEAGSAPALRPMPLGARPSAKAPLRPPPASPRAPVLSPECARSDDLLCGLPANRPDRRPP
jgi:hypothetical protein